VTPRFIVHAWVGSVAVAVGLGHRLSLVCDPMPVQVGHPMAHPWLNHCATRACTATARGSGEMASCVRSSFVRDTDRALVEGSVRVAAVRGDGAGRLRKNHQWPWPVTHQARLAAAGGADARVAAIHAVATVAAAAADGILAALDCHRGHGHTGQCQQEILYARTVGLGRGHVAHIRGGTCPRRCGSAARSARRGRPRSRPGLRTWQGVARPYPPTTWSGAPSLSGLEGGLRCVADLRTAGT
jgi:hypothetical protein